MNIRADRQTDEIHEHRVYVGLAQAQPNNGSKPPARLINKKEAYMSNE